MAISRLDMKVGKTGKAKSHAAYITRTGQYASRLDKGERLLATEVGNLPAWAQANPLEFWQAADTYERANGTTYREMEIALPRELSEREQIALVKSWVQQEIGEKHAYQWAIHVPKASDGGDQPHVHLMFSERQVDGIERDPEQYFKRYNSKSPEKGGARKGYGEHAGQTLSKAERIEDLKALRFRWQKSANMALHFSSSNTKERVDMSSYAERGLTIEAEPKQLPSQWRGEGKKKILALRKAKAEQAQARQALEEAEPLLKAFEKTIKDSEKWVKRRAEELAQPNPDYWEKRKLREAEINLEVTREHIAEGIVPIAGINSVSEEVDRRLRIEDEKYWKGKEEAKQRQEDEQAAARSEAEALAQRERIREKTGLSAEDYARYEPLDSLALAQEIKRITPQSADEWIGRNAVVQRSRDEIETLQNQANHAKETALKAQKEAQDWRAAHGLRTLLHDKGVVQSLYLAQREETAQQSTSDLKRISAALEAAQHKQKQAEAAAQAHFEAEFAPLHRLLEGIERLRLEKVEQERQAEAKRQADEAARREIQQSVKAFKDFAAERATDRMGYTDEQWSALPPALRELVTDYLQQPKEIKDEILRGLEANPQAAKVVAEGLQQAEERTQSRGWSR